MGKQKQIADEKREDARQELERQKNIMREKEKLILRMKAEEDARDIPAEETDDDDEIVKKKNEKIRKLVVLSQLLKQGSGGKLGKLKLTEAHKSLVDASNERILAKIEELKLEKQRESLFEQEQLLNDQRQALAAIKKLKSQRLRNQKTSKLRQSALLQSLRARKNKSEKLQLAKQQTSALLSLSDDEKKQVVSWLDLERNAPILQKTDKAIAAKLSGGKSAALTLGGSGLNLPSSNRVKSAAQVISGGDLSDEEIDAILGIDEGLSDDDRIVFEEPGVSVLDDPTFILDDDDLLFEDYEYEDDFGEDDYEEIIYEYEYEDEEPEVIVEYQYVDEEPPPKPRYKPKYKPSYHHYPQPKPHYHHHKSNLHGHRLPEYPRYHQPRYEYHYRGHDGGHYGGGGYHGEGGG